MKRVSAMLLTLTALGLGGGLLWRMRSTTPAVSAAVTSGASASGASASGASAAGVTAAAESPSAPAVAAPSPSLAAAAGARVAQRQRADAARAQLRQELAGRIRHSGAPAAPGSRRPPAGAGTSTAMAAAAEPAEPSRMPAVEGEGNQAQRPLGKYINETLRQQFIPLAGSCYEQLLQRQPQARGKLMLDLEVVGDDSTGGVVNDVTLADGTTFDDEEFTTCVSESLYSTVFDAPPNDEKSVTISYPLELEP